MPQSLDILVKSFIWISWLIFKMFTIEKVLQGMAFPVLKQCLRYMSCRYTDTVWKWEVAFKFPEEVGVYIGHCLRDSAIRSCDWGCGRKKRHCKQTCEALPLGGENQSILKIPNSGSSNGWSGRNINNKSGDLGSNLISGISLLCDHS